MTPRIAKIWIASSMLPYEEVIKDFCGNLEVNGEPCNGPVAMWTFDPNYSIEERLLAYGTEMDAAFQLLLSDLSDAYESQELSDREFAGMTHALLVGIHRARKTKFELELQKFRRQERFRNWAHKVAKHVRHNKLNKKGGKQ